MLRHKQPAVWTGKKANVDSEYVLADVVATG